MSDLKEFEINGVVYTLKDEVARNAVGSPLTANSSADMEDTTKVYVYTGTTSGSLTNGHWYYYDGDSWEDGGVYNSQGIGNASINGSKLSLDIRSSLMQLASKVLQLAEKVAYIDANGQDYYDDLEDAKDALEAALYPPTNLVSISAVYTQSGTVYETDSLDDLKSDLVVTATYDDSSTETITTYTLSGTLTVGTSTITVTYGGKTTTFTVTVSAIPFDYGAITLSSVVDNQYIDDTGAVTSNNGSHYDTEYFSLTGSATDLIFKSTCNNFRISMYDASNNFIRQIHPSNVYIANVTKASNEKYFRIAWYGSSSSTFNIYNGTALDLVMEIGDIDSTTGEDKTETKRIRSADYIPASGTMDTLNCPFASAWSDWAASNCGFFFRCYDSSYNFVGSLLNGTSMFRGNAINKALPTNTAYVRIVMQKDTNAMSAGFSQDVVNAMTIYNANYTVVEATT